MAAPYPGGSSRHQGPAEGSPLLQRRDDLVREDDATLDPVMRKRIEREIAEIDDQLEREESAAAKAGAAFADSYGDHKRAADIRRGHKTMFGWYRPATEKTQRRRARRSGQAITRRRSSRRPRRRAIATRRASTSRDDGDPGDGESAGERAKPAGCEQAQQPTCGDLTGAHQDARQHEPDDAICVCGHGRRAHPGGGTCLAAVAPGSVCACSGFAAAIYRSGGE
jgi:hypothetical protein